MKKVTPAPKAKGKPTVKKAIPAPAPSKKETALAVVPKPGPVAATSAMDFLAEDAGSGLEGMTKDDFAIPRLAILQALSPAVNKRDEATYVEGAEAGMIYDSVSSTLYDGQEGIDVVFVDFRRSYIEWWPRDSKKGKGFVADHGNNPSVLEGTKRDDKGRNLTAKGTEIILTAEYYAFIVDKSDGSYSRVLIPMSKSQIKISKRINTMASTLMVDVPNAGRKVAPFFYRSYHLSTKPESNDQGNWFGWDVSPAENTLDLTNGEQIYLDARAFRKNIAENKVRVQSPADNDDHSTYQGGASASGDDSPM